MEEPNEAIPVKWTARDVRLFATFVLLGLALVAGSLMVGILIGRLF